MRTPYRTEHDAKQDVKCGLAALHVRYGFIRYEKKLTLRKADAIFVLSGWSYVYALNHEKQMTIRKDW